MKNNKLLNYAVGVSLSLSMMSCFASFKTGDTLTNKEIATKFFLSIVNEKNFDSAANYIGDWYIEHDPQGHDGPSGLKEYINFLQNDFPLSHVEIKRTFVAGEYVVFHVHSKMNPADRGQAIIDIFRLEGGKVVEHWDVTQDIPEISKNGNGMF